MSRYRRTTDGASAGGVLRRLDRGNESAIRGLPRGWRGGERSGCMVLGEHNLHAIERLACDRRGRLPGCVRRLVRRLRVLQVGQQTAVRKDRWRGEWLSGCRRRGEESVVRRVLVGR